MSGTYYLMRINTYSIDGHESIRARVCLSNNEAPRFVDFKGKNTTLFAKNKRTTVWNLLPDIHDISLDKFGWENKNWWPNHFYVDPEYDSLDKRAKTRLRNGLVIRNSNNSDWKIAFGWKNTARVDVNLNPISCIHSHPKFEKLSPGETVEVHGRIWLSQWPIERIVEDYQKLKEHQ